MSDAPASAPGPLQVADLGVVPYREALALQERLRERRRAGAVGDHLLLLEHPPVYTRGRRADPSELPFGEGWYAERGIEVVDVRRGGKVTFHGPGQLVGYVVMATRDVRALVGAIEGAMVSACAELGVAAHGRSDEAIELTGAWTADGRKVGAVGLHLSHGVTTHGLGLNVVTDLTPFEWIVPCGLTEPVTSIARETGAPDLRSDPSLDARAAVGDAGRRVATALAGALGRELRWTTADAIRVAAGGPSADAAASR